MSILICMRTPSAIGHLYADCFYVSAERVRGDCPLSLFDPPERRAVAEAVARLKREVNERHGRFALRSAATLPLASIYRDTANEFDICDVRGKTCF
jgi:hypothetical protein